MTTPTKELTISDALELTEQFSQLRAIIAPGQESSPGGVVRRNLLDHLIGRNVFIRTVTLYYVGELTDVDSDWLCLSEASWVADTGRFSTALETGELNEVERFPNDVLVSRGAIIDLTEWPHRNPETK